ncbi:MAG TPA: hypothetical protein VL527_02450 [Dongiaceae bacterium]|nr:hypothetical protein [Dongiaceae bacterium]
MNDSEINQLLAAARSATPAAPAAGFDQAVLRAIRREPVPAEPTLTELLNRLFPRLAGAAVVLIALCVLGDYAASAHTPDLNDSLAQISQQWLLPGSGL